MNFKSLEKLLTEKYGAPMYRSSDRTVWRTPGTEVELLLIDMPGILTQLGIHYRPSELTQTSMDNL